MRQRQKEVIKSLVKKLLRKMKGSNDNSQMTVDSKKAMRRMAVNDEP